MIKRKELGLGTQAWGQASVLRTETNLIYNGFKVFKPSVDDAGMDLVVVEGKQVARLQVKCSSLITKARGEASSSVYYDFSLTSIRARFDGPCEIRRRKFSGEVDFVILHGVDEDKFWVVPAHLLDDRKSVAIHTNGRSRPDIDWENVRQRREAGETFQSIGTSIGLSASAVLERLRGTTKDAETKIINQLRACENAWHLIDNYFNASTASGTTPP